VPFPGAPDDLFQVREARRPAEFVADLLRRSDQDRRIAGAPRTELIRDGVTGHLSRRLDDLQIGETVAVAQVIRATAQAIKGFERQNVRLRQIEHVDIVAHARAVLRRVIIAENDHLLALTKRHPGAQSGSGAVPAHDAPRGRACRRRR
jgi:hypothetical protein